MIFNWLICGTEPDARNYSLILSGDSVRLAPLYDINSHLAYTDGTSSDLSMGIDGTFRASLLTRQRWINEAVHLHVDPDWLVAEIDRQKAEIVENMRAAARLAGISEYDSPVVARMLAATERWIARLG